MTSPPLMCALYDTILYEVSARVLAHLSPSETMPLSMGPCPEHFCLCGCGPIGNMRPEPGSYMN